MSERLRVMLLLSSLHGGGAERVAAQLLNRCDPRQFDVRMGLLRRAGPFLDEADPTRIDASPIGQRWLEFEGHNSSFYRPEKLLAAATLAPANVSSMIRAHRPHVVMSFLKGMSLLTWAVLAGLGQDRPIWIAREGNNTDAVIDDELANPLARAAVRRLTRAAYRRADCFLVNSHEMARGLEARLRLDHRRVRVIHNPIDADNVRRLAREPLPMEPARPFIVAVGRLEHQKGHDLLLRAYAGSGAARDTDLILLGRGTQETALRRLAAELGVGEHVKFVGFTANPWAWVARARLFVLPSRWEGFPTAVVETLALGAPALVTACEFGPAEIVEHGRSGWVVPPEDPIALGEAMARLLSAPELTSALAAAGPSRAALYDADSMIGAYGALFLEQALARRALPRLDPLVSVETAPA
ncbi:MAG TPA: glycosyltransferase [Caulobacteraceae bacterium]|jgi:glycosyltransferase involved in cell wall biosynthesis